MTPPHTPADPHLWQRRWFRDLLLLAAMVLLVLMMWRARAIVIPAVLGLALAYAVNPLISLAQRRLCVPRLVTTLLVLVVLAAAVVALGWFVVPKLVDQTAQLLRRAGDYTEWVIDHIDWDWLLNLLTPQDNAAAQKNAGADAATADWPGIMSTALAWLGVGLGAVGTVFVFTTYLVVAILVVLFCFIFFSWRFEAMVAWCRELIPAGRRERALHVIGRMDLAVSGFIRGRLIQSLVMATILCVGWKFTNVPYWMLLGVLSGLLNLIPFAAVIGYAAALALTSVDQLTGEQGFTWAMLVWPTVVYTVAQLLDNWVVEPLVQGKSTNLDLLTVLLAVLIGGTLAGVVGMILAIPVVACLKILAQELLLPRLRAAGQSDDGRPPPRI
jgi:predicted PurR-regulated permease PerM